MTQIIARAVTDQVHRDVDELPDDEEEAIETLKSLLIEIGPSYGTGNGYGEKKAADIDAGMAWAVLDKEAGVKPIRKAEDLIDQPVRVQFKDEDLDRGLFGGSDRYGFRPVVSCFAPDPDTGEVKKRTETGNVHPTMLKAAVEALDLIRKLDPRLATMR